MLIVTAMYIMLSFGLSVTSKPILLITVRPGVVMVNVVAPFFYQIGSWLFCKKKSFFSGLNNNGQ